MSRLYMLSTRPPVTRTDHIMQWGYRHHLGAARHDNAVEDFIFIVIGNMLAAFDGDRLFLARATR